MADLNLSADTGLTVTARLYNNATAVGSPIACTEIGTTGEYFANVPGGTAAGKYLAVFFAGALKLASGVIEWDGTKEVILGDVPTAAENATAVRTELAVELARIDAAVSTRSTLLAADVWTVATRTLTEAPGLTPAQALQLTNVEALADALPTLTEIEASTVLAKQAAVTAIGAPLQAVDYVAPASATDIATQVELSILAEGDGRAVLQAIADKIGNENLSAAVVATAVRAELATELGRIDAPISGITGITPQQAQDLEQIKDTTVATFGQVGKLTA